MINRIDRRVASLLLHDRRGRALLVSKDGVLWHLPGGALHDGETFSHALIREVKREVGLKFRKLPRKFKRRVYLSRAGVETRYQIYSCKKGQMRGKVRLNPRDPVKHYKWFKYPLARDLGLNPCTDAALRELEM